MAKAKPAKSYAGFDFKDLPDFIRAQAAARVTQGGTRPLPAPPLGRVRLRAALQKNLGVELELVGGQVAPTGYGGYAPVARRGQVALGAYDGRDPTGLPLQLMADRWSLQKSVQDELDVLETMMGVGDGRPPQLIVEAIGLPFSFHRQPTWRWVMTGDPTWNERRPRADGVICLFDISVTLMRLVRPDAAALSEAIDREDHVVRKDSQLRSLKRIARHYDTTWSRLRQLNPTLKADPDRKLPVGTRVRVS